MRESVLTRRVMEVFREVGGKVVKVHGAVYGEAGTPDILGVVGGVPVAVEVKAGRGRVTPLQERRLREWREAGARAAVVRSVEEARKFVAVVTSDGPSPFACARKNPECRFCFGSRSAGRVVVVGSCPGGGVRLARDDPRVLTGAAGRRLARWVGVSDDIWESVRRVNLVEDEAALRCAVRRSEGARWLVGQVRRWGAPSVVLLGREVRGAVLGVVFGRGFVGQALRFGVAVDEYGVVWTWIPHPSGRNRVYNDRHARVLAEGLMRLVFVVAGGARCGSRRGR